MVKRGVKRGKVAAKKPARKGGAIIAMKTNQAALDQSSLSLGTRGVTKA
jgi:hypothetical protein